jgi:hypothetical protein
MLVELKPSSGNLDFWTIFVIVCTVVLAVPVVVLLVRRFSRFWSLNSGRLRNVTVSSESDNKRNCLSNEELKDILSTYDYSLEVPQTEYKMCKSDF